MSLGISIICINLQYTIIFTTRKAIRNKKSTRTKYLNDNHIAQIEDITKAFKANTVQILTSFLCIKGR